MEPPIIAATIAAVAGFIALLFQRNQFREQRRLTWLDRQLNELYGPLLAIIDELSSELESLSRNADYAFHQHDPTEDLVETNVLASEALKATYAARPDREQILAHKEKLEQRFELHKAQLEVSRAALEYYKQRFDLEEQVFLAVRNLLRTHYELTEPETRDCLPIIIRNLRVYQDHKANVFDEKAFTQIRELLKSDNIRYDVALVSIEKTAKRLIRKRNSKSLF